RAESRSSARRCASCCISPTGCSNPVGPSTPNWRLLGKGQDGIYEPSTTTHLIDRSAHGVALQDDAIALHLLLLHDPETAMLEESPDGEYALGIQLGDAAPRQLCRGLEEQRRGQEMAAICRRGREQVEESIGVIGDEARQLTIDFR